MKISLVIDDKQHQSTIIDALSTAGIDAKTHDSLDDLMAADLTIATILDHNKSQMTQYAQENDLIGLAELDIDVEDKDKASFLAWLTLPVRLGHLIQTVKAYENRKIQRELLKPIKMGAYTLKPARNEIDIKGQKKSVILTGKEQDILLYLYTHQNESIGRQQLLDNVWGYVEGIETHTLETHIYRLRQKIEQNPANPKFLVTDEEGYYLKL